MTTRPYIPSVTEPIYQGRHAPTASFHQFSQYLGNRSVPIDEALLIIYSYLTFGEMFGISPLWAMAQAIHETGAFSSPRWKQSRNPAGLGATNDGAWGSAFASIPEGIYAQFCHLLAYSVPLGEATIPQKGWIAMDTRLAALKSAGTQGVARTWADLNGRWAYPGTTYAQAIQKIAAAILSLPA